MYGALKERLEAQYKIITESGPIFPTICTLEDGGFSMHHQSSPCQNNIKKKLWYHLTEKCYLETIKKTLLRKLWWNVKSPVKWLITSKFTRVKLTAGIMLSKLEECSLSLISGFIYLFIFVFILFIYLYFFIWQTIYLLIFKTWRVRQV